MSNIPTPHIEAKENEIAKSVILTGDPNRATYMAEKFLKKAKLVSSVRGNLCYTGLYRNKKVSIMSCGMGSPSMGIYAYELFKFYNVENIIRVGTAGSIDKSISLGDIVVAKSLVTDTNLYKLAQKNSGETTFLAPKKIVELLCAQVAKKSDNRSVDNQRKICFGKVYSTETFYSNSKDAKNANALCVEMEAGALYATAKMLKKNAIAILTISDNINTKEKMSIVDRETKVDKMFNLALDLAISC